MTSNRLDPPRRALRAALAFLRSAEPRSVPSQRAVAADALLAAVVMVAALIAVRRSGQLAGEFGWRALVTAVLTTAPLAARRIYPLTAFCVILVGTAAAAGDTTAVTFVAVVFAAYSAAVHSRFRGRALLGMVLVAGVVTAAFPDSVPTIPARFTPAAILIPIAIIGNAVHVWQQRAGDSRARIGRLRSEHQAATERALGLERARLAGELHDVVTHNVSVMVVQAGAARQVLADSPEQAVQALLAVESSGRAAMTELRHLLGLLAPGTGAFPWTASDPGPPGEPGPVGQNGIAGAADPPCDAAGPRDPGDADALHPQPGIGQLGALIDRVAATGLPVRLHTTGTPRELAPGPDLAAYRVVQEALTNVLKHAERAPTDVRLDYRAGELVVEIADSGQRAGGDSGSPDSGHAPPRPPPPGPGVIPGARQGLAGLRRRLGLYGGELDAGRRPGGGWRVKARIPLGPAPSGPGPAAGPATAPVTRDP